VGSTIALACARHVHAAAGLLAGAVPQEHERGTGGWQAEWPALTSALAFTGGAAAWMREVLEGLEIDAGRMRENLDATNGLVMAERVATALGERLGRPEAQALVRAATERAAAEGVPLREALAADPRVELLPEQLDELFDPAGYLGSAEAFVDRALERARAELGGAA
jgi:3-carboxy-cis,cis-muconate cycloisomerase